MAKIAYPLNITQPSSLLSGDILSYDTESNLFGVLIEGRKLMSRRSSGCLIVPEIGDSVLLFSNHDAYLWILTVLERQQAASPLLLQNQSGLLFDAENGPLQLKSGGVVSVNATCCQLRVDELQVEGKKAIAFIRQCHITGERLHTVWKSLTQHCHSVFRRVKCTDQLRSAHIDYRSEELTQFHAENTVITSGQLLRIDAENINIG